MAKAKAKPKEAEEGPYPVKKAELSNVEKYYKGKMPKSFYKDLDENYPDEFKPADPPDNPPGSFVTGFSNNVSQGTKERRKGNSINIDIELPSPEKKRKRSVASY